MIKQLIIISCIIWTMVLPTQGQEIGGGPYAGLSQLTIVPRISGLGGAGVASAYGPSAALTNPGLVLDSARAKILQLEVSGRFGGNTGADHVMNSSISDVQLLSLSSPKFTYPKTQINGVMAINILLRNYGEYKTTSLSSSNEIILSSSDPLTAQDVMVIPTLGFMLLDYKVGVSPKLVNQNYVQDQGWMQLAGFDMGIVMNIFSDFQEDPEIRLSPQLYDLLRLTRMDILLRWFQFRFNGQVMSVPFVDDIEFGVVFHKNVDPVNESRQVDLGIAIKSKDELKRFLIDAKTSDFAYPIFNTGIEYGFNWGLSVRGGVSMSNSILKPSVGLGFRIPRFDIDISYIPLSTSNTNNYDYLIDSPFRVGFSATF